MQYKIRGTTMPVLDIQLEAGETIYSESSGMAWMTPNIEMDTTTKGGLGAAFGRALSGDSLFVTKYSCNSGSGMVTFCMEIPGNIVALDISDQNQITAQKDSFMVAEDGVDVKVEFKKKLGAGFFGGEGFLLQKITGNGKAFLEFAGEITEYNLEADQMLKIDPGYIGAFETSVTYDITRVKGLKNMFFGGEGLFLATLKGPGKIWLQSMPLSNLAAKLSRYLPTSS